MSALAAASGLAIEAGVLDAGPEALLDPGAPAWETVPGARLALEPTPLDRLPSAYVRAAWAKRPRANPRQVEVRALMAAGTLSLRLCWAAPRPVPARSDLDAFPDACAVLFPADGVSAPLGTMGSRRRPVAGWHWQAGGMGPFALRARGLGTVERAKADPLRAQARHEAGSWSVVLSRPVDPGSPFSTGRRVPVAFAIWCGAARERAGIKSHTPSWQELRLP